MARAVGRTDEYITRVAKFANDDAVCGLQHNCREHLALYRRSRRAGIRLKTRRMAGLAKKSVERSRWRLRRKRLTTGIRRGILACLGLQVEKRFEEAEEMAKMESENRGEVAVFRELVKAARTSVLQDRDIGGQQLFHISSSLCGGRIVTNILAEVRRECSSSSVAWRSARQALRSLMNDDPGRALEPAAETIRR